MGLVVLRNNQKTNTIMEGIYKTIRIAFFILVTSLAIESHAQLDSSSFNYTVEYIADLNASAGYDTVYFHKINLDVNDTLSISKIKVKIGSSLGLEDLESYEYLFDVDTFLPANYTYSRDGNQIELVVGKRVAGTFYYEVSIIDTGGNTTLPKKWNN